MRIDRSASGQLFDQGFMSMTTRSNLGVLGGLVAAYLLGAGVAFAQPKPALTKEIDGPGREIFRESESGDCDLLASCSFAIPVTVPAGRRLVITHVSANAWLNGDAPGMLIGQVVNVFGGSLTIDFSAPGPGDRRAWNGPVTFYVEPGETLAATVRSPAGALFVGGPSVTLMGHFVLVP